MPSIRLRMRWAILGIVVVASGVFLMLWSSGGKESTPMLLVATGIVLFFASAPLFLSKRPSAPRGRRESTPRDR